MELEDQLLNLLLKCPNSGMVRAIAEQLEFEHNFSFNKDKKLSRLLCLLNS